MKLIIEDDEGRRTLVPLFRDELIIGRAQDSAIRLVEKDVSRRHARLVRRDGRVYLEDLNSFTGVRVNGYRLGGPHEIRDGDLIQIGGYDLRLQLGPDEAAALDARAAEHDTAKIRTARARFFPRRAWIATFVVGLLVAAALAAAFWPRAGRGADASAMLHGSAAVER
jgi:pSer/pThr/pTyr-binding forkhead associated (FHA) protein